MTRAPINLIPKSIFAERARRRAIHAWSVAVGLCLLLMLAMVTLGAGQAEAPDTAALQGRLNAANKQSDQLVQQINRSRQRIDAVQRELASAMQVVDQPDLQLLMQIVGQQLGERAMLSSIRLGAAEEATIRQTVGNNADPARRWIVLAGIAEDHQVVPGIVLRLEALGLFDKVVLHETFPESYRGAARVGFRIACRLPDVSEAGVEDE